jgi:hypothetical protein
MMPNNSEGSARTPRVTHLLVKLRPSGALRAAESRANLRPLYAGPEAEDALLGIGSEPQWFLAELPDGPSPTGGRGVDGSGQGGEASSGSPFQPWDFAHGRVAEQLGVAESDVIFAEPDLIHDWFRSTEEMDLSEPFAVGGECEKQVKQEGDNGKAVGPDKFAWHLDDEFSQLGSARDAVAFGEPRTRIAHLDTGYYRKHASAPQHVLHDLERNFADRDGDPLSAEDPDNQRRLMDNSGHGTGTLGILAGRGTAAGNGQPLGGAPAAGIVPLRIADRVVLLRTSAFARALRHAVDAGCDVVTMSMGGLPSRVWKEAVDGAYMAGVCVVSAAGNNFSGLPTRHIVYPARYGRVIAACGVMADGRSYSRLQGLRTMEGNYGPGSKMGSAMAAYTPNIPWAVFGCEDLFRLNGAGTSSATPQIAAAAALWFEKYKHELPRDWRRVEAVRHALFSTAKNPSNDRKRLGHGILQAFAALQVRPALGLKQTKRDRDSFAFLRLITGLGLAEPTVRELMFNLELAQLWLLNPALQEAVEDPDSTDRVDEKELRAIMEAVMGDERASRALRRHMAERWPVVTGKSVPRPDRFQGIAPQEIEACDGQPSLPEPPHRRLRVYAVDPSLSGRLETASTNEVTLKVRWEKLGKGPVGEYLAVRDRDATGQLNEPVDLDDPRLLARDGWKPSEGNAQFHQQMVYGVAMKTIEHFERALGRPVLWRPAHDPKRPLDDSGFVRQLTVRPHALHQANAYYSPRDVALLFGYFEAPAHDPGELMPGSRIYTCLSHDIIAHETTHAILDGMHRRFNEPSNPDVLAFHEAFADMVALLQHFSIPEVLEGELARTRGDLEAESALGSLAVQFGRGTGRSGGLREAIGTMEGGVWKRLRRTPRSWPGA